MQFKSLTLALLIFGNIIGQQNQNDFGSCPKIAAALVGGLLLGIAIGSDDYHKSSPVKYLHQDSFKWLPENYCWQVEAQTFGNCKKGIKSDCLPAIANITLARRLVPYAQKEFAQIGVHVNVSLTACLPYCHDNTIAHEKAKLVERCSKQQSKPIHFGSSRLRQIKAQSKYQRGARGR